MEKNKHIGLRIDEETHALLKDLVEYEGRSINGEILFLIRQAVRQYQEKSGGGTGKPENQAFSRVSGKFFSVLTDFSDTLPVLSAALPGLTSRLLQAVPDFS